MLKNMNVGYNFLKLGIFVVLCNFIRGNLELKWKHCSVLSSVLDMFGPSLDACKLEPTGLVATSTLGLQCIKKDKLNINIHLYVYFTTDLLVLFWTLCLVCPPWSPLFISGKDRCAFSHCAHNCWGLGLRRSKDNRAGALWGRDYCMST